MPSKMVLQRLRSSRIVVEAARVHGPRAGDGIRARLPEGDPGAAAIAPLCESLAIALESTATAMDEADAAHEAELGDDASPRRERDEATETLVRALVDLRGGIEMIYGHDVATRVGFTGTTPREPTAAATLATRVLEHLGTLSESSPQMPGTTFDPTPFTNVITEVLGRLQSALQAIAREAREAEQTLIAKQAALAEYDATFQAVATTLEGLFSLARESELAHRVRPSRRRPGQVHQPPEPAPAEGDAA